ncbi:PQQ-dependent sugar dehydrogenase [Chitinophaga sancti]|uniref:Glucose/arabinose dehydrogenase, beta-propeller fold n=1 Tax=Chitinophaga sancti TaxID=1004 RepID=A0A1K1SC04_9BACT|nr:PQQ-dependent sugar dehydrogenase [Chitinophaga sancti]WQD63540.1 PQQ-dependent sugar dehydrogenase [Chitinophaga sancti]WQG90834.1 PQQ-dependent sugar dehydrogenase [Chitinophaga sancti]SFW81636.1 Glucose/arabinose dehydrogenase, beta-propeller fold [Chitinophaga sancti]
MNKITLATVALATFLTSFGPGVPGTTIKPDADNAGLKLPTGFGALVATEGLGHARHLTVTPEGDLYVKVEGTRNKGNTIWYLQDTNGDGKIDKKTGFFKYDGTGIEVKGNYLYASSNTDVYRFKLNDKHQVIDTTKAETIVTGLINRHQHEAKAFTLDNDGNLYVNIGAYSNSCQTKDRTRGSLGMQPCPILDSAGGIWQFKADKANQAYGDGTRYATGLRNVVGLDWNTQLNQLFVMQHGRDQLHDLFPDQYDEKQSAELPAECMYALHKGSDCGWPYIYYDQFQHKKILAPEYGGDGKKTGGDHIQDPAAAYPGHMAPNAILFYTGNMFPEKYRNGAFIAFHGSWNRAPEPQKGYFVVFQPFKDGKPAGDWEIFAEGFAGTGEIKSPGQAAHRPCGLAQGPDGSLYVSDDVKGTVYRIIYNK